MHVGRLFTAATAWDLGEGSLGAGELRALLRHNGLRRVAASRLHLTEDCSGEACTWEALTLRHLQRVEDLRLLPSGLGLVVVTEHLACPEPGDDSEALVAELLQQGTRRLRFQMDGPPRWDAVVHWLLQGEEQEASFFTLDVRAGAQGNLRLLQQTVLPLGGGPRTLELRFRGDVRDVVQQLSPLLAGTRVRTLCADHHGDRVGGLGGVLATLPASLTCLRLGLSGVKHARKVLSGEAARHAVRLVLLFDSDGLSVAQERELRELCASYQPLVRLQVVRRLPPLW